MMTTDVSEVQCITHLNHPALQNIERLRRRDVREHTGRFYVEGLRFVAQAVQHHVPIELLVTSHPLLIHPFAQKLVRILRRAGTPVLEVTAHVMRQLSRVEDSQGIGAVVRQHWEPLAQVMPQRELCWLALQTVCFPGNLGTILRTSEAVGGAGVILLGNDVDPYDPAAVRATMGAIFSQRFARATVGEFRRWKAQHHVLLVGTSPSASVDYHAAAYRSPTVLLMGDERKGLPPELQTMCDLIVRIPMVGESDSLNLSVATGIMLYEMFNQRR
jgi:TrmH family RNA methyltransferase